MNSTPNERDAVELLAEDFLDRFRRGERPSLTEYENRNPDLAGQIRHLSPALVALEQIGASANPGVERFVPAGLTRIGEYRILREVGRGGMGVVFEAVQESLGRHVALKVLPPALCRDNYLERFQREAKAAASLHHTNIVPVFGVGADLGMHFYVMQFIDGRGLDGVIHEVRRLRTLGLGQSAEYSADDPNLSSLARNLLSGTFAPSSVESGDKQSSQTAVVATDQTDSTLPKDQYYYAVARLGRQVAEALHHAHTQGVLHRDVKPSNLLLDSSGTVWISDFGLAKADDSEDLTDTGDLIGTLRYMAPERLQGRGDARSDIHGLGLTLFELLALRPAFDAPGRLRLMDQVARGEAPALRQLVPELPRDLEMVVSKAMAKEPADRYASAQELAEDLGRFVANLPVRARQVPVYERLERWCRRHPAVAILATAIVALLATGAAGGWWAAARLRQEVAAVTTAEAQTTERLREARLAEARAGRASRLPGQRFKSLEAIADAARIRPDRELRNQAVACFALTDVQVEQEWDADLETNLLAFSTGVAFDPTLEHYAFTSADGTVSVRATFDGQLVARLDGMGGPADFLRFSPDGRYLAARFNNGLPHPCRVWDWREGKVVFERLQASSYFLSLDFRPDSKSLVLVARSGLETVALPSGQTIATTKLNIAPDWLAVEPEVGNLVAVCGQRTPKLRVVELTSGRVVAAWDNLPAELVAVAWHPRGTLLAASGRDGNLYTFGLDSRSPPTILRRHTMEARELAFSPDGAQLVSRAWDGTTRFWDPVEAHELLRVRGQSFLQFSRDGHRLAYRGYNTKRLGIWELADQSVCRVLHGPRPRVPQAQAGVSFSQDSQLLATSAGESVCIWDPPTGRLLGQIDTGQTTDVLFDPGGRYLYTVGDRGSLAWELSRTQGVNGRLRQVVGPIQLLSTPLGPLLDQWLSPLFDPPVQINGYQLHADRAGDRLALVERFSCVVISPPPGDLGSRVVLRDHPQVSSAALSPDGRSVATGTWHGKGVKIWDASIGRLVHELPTEESAGVGFSPDGSRLLVLEPDVAYRSHLVGAWDQQWERRDADAGFTRGLRAAFHPSGRIMAHVSDRVDLRLVDLETGDELAVLPVPESQNLSGYQFSPDGRYVAAITVQGAVQLWDLRRLRGILRANRLDWDPPDTIGELVQFGGIRLEVRNSHLQVRPAQGWPGFIPVPGDA